MFSIGMCNITSKPSKVASLASAVPKGVFGSIESVSRVVRLRITSVVLPPYPPSSTMIATRGCLAATFHVSGCSHSRFSGAWVEVTAGALPVPGRSFSGPSGEESGATRASWRVSGALSGAAVARFMVMAKAGVWRDAVPMSTCSALGWGRGVRLSVMVAIGNSPTERPSDLICALDSSSEVNMPCCNKSRSISFTIPPRLSVSGRSTSYSK